MTTFHKDMIMEIMEKSDYRTLLTLCQSSKNFSNLCRTNPEIKRLILEKKTDDFLWRLQHRQFPSVFDFESPYPVAVASKMGDVELMRELIRRGYDPSENDNAPLINAVTHEKYQSVDFLLRDRRVDPNARNYHALIRAAQQGNYAIVDRLLQDLRLDPTGRNGEAIDAAATSYKFFSSMLRSRLKDPKMSEEEKREAMAKLRSEKEYMRILQRLLHDPRVWNSLSYDDKSKYANQLRGCKIDI